MGGASEDLFFKSFVDIASPTSLSLPFIDSKGKGSAPSESRPVEKFDTIAGLLYIETLYIETLGSLEPSLLSDHFSWALVFVRAFFVSKKPSAILFFIVYMRVLTLKTQTAANIKYLGYPEYTIN